MWILMMIMFNQPYQIQSIRNIGEYSKKENCMKERQRAIDLINSSNHNPTAFGCILITLKKRTYL